MKDFICRVQVEVEEIPDHTIADAGTGRIFFVPAFSDAELERSLKVLSEVNFP
jgi:hypothetical protein